MSRTGVLAGSLAAVGLLVGCAGVPDVQEHVRASSTVWITGGDRAVYRVELGLNAVDGVATNPESYLTIDVAKCAKTCAAPLQFVAVLDSAGYDVSDKKNMVAKYAAFGKPILWKLTGPGPSQTGVAPTSQADRVSLESRWAAVGKVTIFGVTCEDKNASAARSTTAYPGGYVRPANRKDAPVRAVPGTPTGATKCSAARPS
ncbi:MAG TPA: hypothetical protein VNA30_01755 [Mycobacteriales bacterium]|nr:hypothetical protein [Mycobacteriales bacterium]